MTQFQAMQTVDQHLPKLKYIFLREQLGMQERHLTFQMDSHSHEVQMSLNFRNKALDVLTFISPTILTFDSPTYWESVKTVNYINTIIQSLGRFYVDASGDIVYRLNIDYTLLEQDPVLLIRELDCAIDYFSDLFTCLLDVAQGKLAFAEAMQFINLMWSVED